MNRAYGRRAFARTLAFWLLTTFSFFMVAAVAAGWVLVIVPVGGR